MLETTTEKFERDVIEASRETPVLVDFWAPWCGPCRMVGPMVEKLEAAAGGRWRLVKVNTDVELPLAQMFNIQSIPALKLFVDGKVEAELAGALPEAQMAQWLDQYIPSAQARSLEEALAARAAGDDATARAKLEAILAHDPENSEARVTLAELLFMTDRARAMSLVDGTVDDGSLTDRLDALERLDAISNRPVDEDGDTPTWKRYREGIDAFVGGDTAAAAEAWIDVVARDRKLDDEGARKACLALFVWLGDEHPVTREYRPQLASALF